jgi:hypothetical protein
MTCAVAVRLGVLRHKQGTSVLDTLWSPQRLRVAADRRIFATPT